MKNHILIYTFILITFPFYSWAQKNLLNEKKIGVIQSNSIVPKDPTDVSKRKIKYYHVEEIYDLKFGSHQTVYDVSNPKLIPTYDLGPNNKRIVTPIYDKEETIVETTIKSNTLKKIDGSNTLSIADSLKKTNTADLQLENTITIAPSLSQKEQQNKTPINLNSSNLVQNSTKLSFTDTPKKAPESSYVDIIKTYEGVVEKGFETLDILKKLANSFFFNNELEKAEKYYTKLFFKTTDLEPEYYYRYSVALKSIGQTQKADEFLKKFKQLSITTKE